MSGSVVHEVADPDTCLQPRVDGGVPSLMDLVHQCHNYDPWSDDQLYPFVLGGRQIGFIPQAVYEACIRDNDDQLAKSQSPVLGCIQYQRRNATRPMQALCFSEEIQTFEERTDAMNALAQRWRTQRRFPDPLDGWRDELYAIYGPSECGYEMAFKLERSACALFGFATFGVHLTAYTTTPQGEIRVWVPTRSSTKSTWPGYLDNSVAGGIVAGDTPMSSIVRECEEEAALPPHITTRTIRQTGVLSYVYRTKAPQHYIQPEVEYIYDLPLPPEITLQPKDGEVEKFELLSLPQIQQAMEESRFKPNCVLVLLDFLIRHGHITADKEKQYRQIVAQIHTDLHLPGP